MADTKADLGVPACPVGTEHRPYYKPNQTRHDVANNACVQSNVIAPKEAIRKELHAAMKKLGYTQFEDYIAYVRVMPLKTPDPNGNCSCMCGCS